MTVLEQKRRRATEMSEHFERLCMEHDVDFVYYTGDGRAFPRERKVMVRRVLGPSTYFTALHELAHVVGPGRSGHKLDREARAWEWAFKVAIRKPTYAVRIRVAQCLRSYLFAGRRGRGLRQGMIEPREDHVFWDLANPRVAGMSRVHRQKKP